ncbi:DUF7619 domain-containing protein [Flavobacterium silvaticum]|uniref:T9SS type A sorting domain-containing protein n=1 Tax=Flavobacterium silvaticum TaxID=1852020 RepID=A0A972FMG5_9FLAO|nr:T9SS type A sorting domain-containing protein [Flavobacterium silvaticum]NMH28726.1 T9SS type A sorting domain-containing protein [Flavobacterium silvaticum]
MNKLCLIFLLAALSAKAQLISFSDPNFKNALLLSSAENSIAFNENNMQIAIDANADGDISQQEALAVVGLNVSTAGISNLAEISYFTSLKRLACSGNQLNSLDVSQLVDLENLDVKNNLLSGLDLSNNLQLKGLDISTNEFATIDLSSLALLESFTCEHNLLSELSLDDNPALFSLHCGGNNLTALDLSNLPEIIFLGIEENHISQLEIPTTLYEFGGYSNDFTELDFSNCPDLYFCVVDYNLSLTHLNLKNGNPYFSAISFFYTPNLDYICVNPGQLDQVQENAASSQGNPEINTYCSFVPGGVYYTVNGTNRIDINGNGCDVSDYLDQNLKFQITDGISSRIHISNASGNYTIPFTTGSYTITPVLENPEYFSVFPTNLSVDFPTDQSPMAQNFCLSPTSVHHDVEIFIQPLTPLIPGFDADYIAVVRNKGNRLESGTVNLMYDDALLDPVALSFEPDSTGPGYAQWNFSNIVPFSYLSFFLRVHANTPQETPAVNSGDVLNFTASVTLDDVADEVPSNNSGYLAHTVVNSYDPNTIVCSEGDIVGTEVIGQYVHYIISFENTGTFPAQNIVAKINIDPAKFDISTLLPLNANRDFYVRINGNTAEFIFNNINLTNVEQYNKAFVGFKIKTLQSLVAGDFFENTATVYFDYNFPIVTDPALTLIQSLAVSDAEFSDHFILYPNPAETTLNIKSDGATITSTEVYNMLGQLVLSAINSDKIDLAGLESGNYLLRVHSDKGVSTVRFTKK